MQRATRFSSLAIAGSLAALIVAGLIYQQLGERRDAVRFPAPGKLVTIGDHRLHLRCTGAGTPTVLILSGGGTPAVTSFAVQDGIAAFTRVCSYDRAGLGWSSRGTHDAGLREMTDELQALLVRGGVRSPYVLVPESFGGLLALSLMHRMPDQLAGAVFVDAVEPQLWRSAMPGATAEWRWHDRWWSVAVRTGAVRALFDIGAPAWVRALPTAKREQFRSVYAKSTLGYAEAATAFETTKPADVPQVTPGLFGSKPLMLLVHGRQDAILGPAWQAGWPSAQRRLATLSINSRIVVVTDASHMIAGENPAVVVGAVREVVNRINMDRADKPVLTKLAKKVITGE